jgi:hypothetical protein
MTQGLKHRRRLLLQNSAYEYIFAEAEEVARGRSYDERSESYVSTHTLSVFRTSTGIATLKTLLFIREQNQPLPPFGWPFNTSWP